MVPYFKVLPILLATSCFRSQAFVVHSKTRGLNNVPQKFKQKSSYRVGIETNEIQHYLLTQRSTATQLHSFIAQDVACLGLTSVAATIWVKIWTTLASRGKIDPKLSRKIIHCGSGPLFVAVWPFFSPTEASRYFATVVPMIQVFRLVKAGLSRPPLDATPPTEHSSLTKAPTPTATPDLVAAISRSGKASEALGGPLLYTLVLATASLFFWRTSPVGIAIVAQMAAGDGLADIVGRKFGAKNTAIGGRWPWNPAKSYAGSAGFVFGGFLCHFALLVWHLWLGCIDPAILAGLAAGGTGGTGGTGGQGWATTSNLFSLAWRVGLISVASALVETLPTPPPPGSGNGDNKNKSQHDSKNDNSENGGNNKDTKSAIEEVGSEIATDPVFSLKRFLLDDNLSVPLVAGFLSYMLLVAH